MTLGMCWHVLIDALFIWKRIEANKVNSGIWMRRKSVGEKNSGSPASSIRGIPYYARDQVEILVNYLKRDNLTKTQGPV